MDGLAPPDEQNMALCCRSITAALERTATANGVETVDLVLADKNSRTELVRTPVEGGRRQWRQTRTGATNSCCFALLRHIMPSPC